MAGPAAIAYSQLLCRSRRITEAMSVMESTIRRVRRRLSQAAAHADPATDRAMADLLCEYGNVLERG